MVFRGMKLRLIRTERMISTADLAKACGITAQAISALESGKAKEPKNLRTLSCLAEHLGVQISDLCDDVPVAWRGPAPVRDEDSEDRAIYLSLSRRLRMAREGLDLSVQQFAARYGLDEAQWQSVEDGNLRPNISILKRLCLDHDITLDFLVFGILRTKPPPLMAIIRRQHPEIVDEDPTGVERSVPFSMPLSQTLKAMLYSLVIGTGAALPSFA